MIDTHVFDNKGDILNPALQLQLFPGSPFASLHSSHTSTWELQVLQVNIVHF